MNHYPALQLVHAGGILTEALLDGCRLPLTQRERSLLNNLAREPGKVLLRDVLMEQHGMTDHELYNQIYRLRRKIGRHYVEQVGGRSGCGAGAGSGYRLSGLQVEWVEVRAG